MTDERDRVVKNEERTAALEAAYELLRAILNDRSSPPKEPGMRLCVERGLLEFVKGFPPYPKVTPKGAFALVTLIDDFDRYSKEPVPS